MVTKLSTEPEIYRYNDCQQKPIVIEMRPRGLRVIQSWPRFLQELSQTLLLDLVAMAPFEQTGVHSSITDMS